MSSYQSFTETGLDIYAYTCTPSCLTFPLQFLCEYCFEHCLRKLITSPNQTYHVFERRSSKMSNHHRPSKPSAIHSRTSSVSSTETSSLSRSRTISSASSSTSTIAARRMSQVKRPWQLLAVVTDRLEDESVSRSRAYTRSPYPHAGKRNLNRV